MAPKNKFTKEEMVAAALQVVRTKGIEGLTAKTMAAADCSIAASRGRSRSSTGCCVSRGRRGRAGARCSR